MIGVIADPEDHWAVEEFFELFKTPWEWAVPGRRYSVVLSGGAATDELESALVLVYSADPPPLRPEAVPFDTLDGPVAVSWKDFIFPIYGRVAMFGGPDANGALRCGNRPLDHRQQSGRAVRWIGYDLFGEVRHLLEKGQPASQAATPTLELHIALLRSLLLEHGMSFLEIPPAPENYDFICCLTHDVDFYGIRRHFLDRTLAGFVARASFGTLIDVVRRRRRATEAVQNWVAVASLPFVFLGLARDFWSPFHDYGEVERGHPSTFFLIPFKGRPGVAPNGTVDSTRAVRYQLSEIQGDLVAPGIEGTELGVHGIDAWRDAQAGEAELRELTSITGQMTAGVRMHWLYFSATSPDQLEAAGFDYDSTWGYNDAVGYRAGTSQAFGLPGTESMLELPLSIMDSALFYSDRMGLDEDGASAVCSQLIANARRFGGTLVLNWHCRSLAPERLWGRFYQRLLAAVAEGDRAWFATAGEAVSWFRWRRSIRFTTSASGSSVTVAAPPCKATWPAAIIRLHRPAVSGSASEDVGFRSGQQPTAVTV